LITSDAEREREREREREKERKKEKEKREIVQHNEKKMPFRQSSLEYQNFN